MCHGGKHVKSMGGMTRNCPVCNGVGFMDNKIDTKTVTRQRKPVDAKHETALLESE